VLNKTRDSFRKCAIIQMTSKVTNLIRNKWVSRLQWHRHPQCIDTTDYIIPINILEKNIPLTFSLLFSPFVDIDICLAEVDGYNFK